DALAAGDEGRIVAHPAARATKAEGRIERKPRLYGRPRLLRRAEQRERSGQLKMRERIIPVGLEAPAQPCHGFGVVAEDLLGKTNIMQPAKGEDIARRKPKRFLDVRLGVTGPAA